MKAKADPASNLAKRAELVPKLVYFYMLVFFAALVFIVIKASPDFAPATLSDPVQWVTLDGMPPPAIFYALALVMFAMAFVLPTKVLRATLKARAPSGAVSPTLVLPAYVIRLCLFEATALSGFLLAFLRHAPPLIVPTLLLALAGMFTSAPAPVFFERFIEKARN